jgi:hypothetical protein
LEEKGGKLYSVTATEHYIRLTFQRDPASIPDYQEIAALDEEYFSVPHPGRRSNLFSKPSLIIMGIGVFFFILGAVQSSMILSYMIFGVGIVALRVFLHIRKNSGKTNNGIWLMLFIQKRGRKLRKKLKSSVPDV